MVEVRAARHDVCGIASLALVKNLVQPRLLVASLVALPPMKVRIVKVRLSVVPRSRPGCCGRGYCGRFVEQLVEFTPIQPNAATSRTIVNFDTLSISHHQGCFGATRAFHSVFQWVNQ